MAAPCCPDTNRIEGRETVAGLPVEDLHPHKGMLRGFVYGSSAPVFWHRNGRISPLAETGHDLEPV